MIANHNWIQTYSGKAFEPLNPDASLICIEDIAHALSNICRYTGHVRTFYSVAQHSVLVSHNVSPAAALAGLLHDAGEAYLTDLARPVKHHPDLAAYREAEKRLDRIIAARFGLPFPLPDEVAAADRRALLTERRDLMGLRPAEWHNIYTDVQPWPTVIVAWPPETAKRLFLNRYRELT